MNKDLFYENQKHKTNREKTRSPAKKKEGMKKKIGEVYQPRSGNLPIRTALNRILSGTY